MATDAEMQDLRGRLQVLETEAFSARNQMVQIHTDFAIAQTTIASLMDQRSETEANWKSMAEATMVKTKTELDQHTAVLTQNLQQVGNGAQQGFAGVVDQFQKAKADFESLRAATNTEFQLAKTTIDELRNNIVKEVETQRAEFGNQNSRLTILEAAGTAQGGANIPQIFKKLEDRINNPEKGTSGSSAGGGHKHKGYLPAKSMVPQKKSAGTQLHGESGRQKS